MSLVLQRLAGLEEVLPLPDVDRCLSCSVSKESEGAIKASILKVGVFTLLVIFTSLEFSFLIYLSCRFSILLLESIDFTEIILLPD